MNTDTPSCPHGVGRAFGFRSLLAGASLFAAAASMPLAAADYYLQTDMAGAASLNNTAIYNSVANGSGGAPDDISGNDFFSNGKTVRWQNGNSISGVFAGTSFTLDAGSQLKASAGYTVGTLKVVAGAGDYAGKVGIVANTGGVSNPLTVTNLVIASGASLALTHLNATNATLTLAIGTLTGSGDISIGGVTRLSADYRSVTGNTVILSATTASAYTGIISWGSLATQNVILDFDGSFATAGSLVARANDHINLDESLTFSSVTIAGTLLTEGTHSFASLKSTFGDVFLDGGSGSITVAAIPEPASFAALIGGLALVCVAAGRRGRSRATSRA